MFVVVSFSTVSAATLSDSISSSPKRKFTNQWTQWPSHFCTAHKCKQKIWFSSFCFWTILTLANWSQLLMIPLCKDASKKIIDSVMYQTQVMLRTILGFTVFCHVSFYISDNEDWHFLMLSHLKLSIFVLLLATFLLTIGDHRIYRWDLY